MKAVGAGIITAIVVLILSFIRDFSPILHVVLLTALFAMFIINFVRSEKDKASIILTCVITGLYIGFLLKDS
ncbi:hypothetical protein ACW2QC_08500 [Virgibacillus sp. FSP13]